MRQITILDDNPNQSFYFTTGEGENLHFVLIYKPRQQSWFLDVEGDTFKVYGIRVCCHPNLLDKYNNLINYGICIQTIDGLDPWRVTDFKDDYCSFNILSKEEKEKITAVLDGI